MTSQSIWLIHYMWPALSVHSASKLATSLSRSTAMLSAFNYAREAVHHIQRFAAAAVAEDAPGAVASDGSGARPSWARRPKLAKQDTQLNKKILKLWVLERQ
ncbi:unnamed protein product [Durusdinium trenchii]|uniref:Uncharacterized protein n=1 Tax=Durusdinium trenchii TaxID=1381693 RepID=A0ABP0S343_9DINO